MTRRCAGRGFFLLGLTGELSAGLSVAFVLAVTLLAVAFLAGAASVSAQSPGTQSVSPQGGDGPVEPVRLASEIFGGPLEIEVRDLPRQRAEAAIRAAIFEAFEISLLADPDGDRVDGLGALNRAAGGPPVALDPRIVELLARAQQYCVWSENAHGPLGGRIYVLWRSGTPDPRELRDAIENATCDRLRLEAGATPRARLAAGARADVRGMQRGFAVDRAMAVLREHGARNAVIEVDSLVRAIGVGLEERGWPVAIPGVEGTRHPLDQVWLHDQSLALSRADSYAERPIDLRDGVPSRGVVQVAAVSELAMDVEALATTLYVLGLPSGKRLLGRLSPRPSVLWLLGTTQGTPLESTYLWSNLDRERTQRRPRRRY